MPYAGPLVPMQALVAAHPRLAYQLYFDKQTHAAVTELERDIRRTLRSILRHVASPPPEDFLTSLDTMLGAWDRFEEVLFSIPLVLKKRLAKPSFRSRRYHFCRRTKKIIGSSNIASRVLNTVNLLSPPPPTIYMVLFLTSELPFFFYQTFSSILVR